MNGARRVVTFCFLTAVLPTILLIIPLYLRHSVYADVTYAVAESDVLEAIDGISTVFCQEQILRMNKTFRAFQLKQMPPLSSEKKYIHLKKAMALPDDTLEYWGFYLLRGSSVTLSACSRYEGARVLVVKGERNLRTCGLKDHPRQDTRGKAKGTSRFYTLGPQISSEGNPNQETNSRKPDLLTTTALSMETNIKSPVAEEFVDAKNADIKPDVLDSERGQTKDDQKYVSNLSLKNDFVADDEKSQNVPSTNTQPTKFRHSKKKHRSRSKIGSGHFGSVKNQTSEYPVLNGSVLSGVYNRELAKKRLQEELQQDISIEDDLPRLKRDAFIHSGIILDAKVGHGVNITEHPDRESSESSFEANLRECYDGREIFTEQISPSQECSHHYVNNQSCVVRKTDIFSDGYYYFIFYSDNEIHVNPIYANFDIYKATYQSTNYSKGCINQTECKFPLSFWSNEVVIVEIPTHDGIEYNDNDESFLISSCYPRMSIYVTFPIAVLLLILGCAFL